MTSAFWGPGGNGLYGGFQRSATVVAWTPASLGAALMAWYDPSDLTTLFQDPAGTTPVAADGDPVGLMRDKSGNARHVTQAGASQKPLWRANSGKPYLDFDGSNDAMDAATFVMPDGSGQHSSLAAVRFDTNTGTQTVLMAPDASGIAQFAQLLRLNGGNAETIAFNTDDTPFTDVGAALGATTNYVLSEVTNTTTTEVFVNGASGGSTAVSGTLKTNTAQLIIGAFNTGGSSGMDGRFFGGFICAGALSPVDRVAGETYLAAKM